VELRSCGEYYRVQLMQTNQRRSEYKNVLPLDGKNLR